MTQISSFQRLALSTTAITYVLILVGGLVRASGAGLGCPDWPRCFGGWIPPMSAAALPPQFDPSQFNPTLMWTEYLNRLLGMAVGLFILATVVSAWRHHRRDPRILWTSIAALLLTGFQGWLGGRVVAHELAAWIVTVHMIVALAIVQMLLYVTVVSMGEDKPEGVSPPTGRGDKPFSSAEARGDKPFSSVDGRGDKPLGLSIGVLMVATLIQIATGTQVRGAVDAALDAGVARPDALATVGWLDYLHRDTAIAVLVGAIALTVWLVARRRNSAGPPEGGRHIPFAGPPEGGRHTTNRGGQINLVRWSYAVLALAALQVAIGVVMAYVSLLPAAQVLHLTIASLLLGAETVLFLLSWREMA